MATFAEAIRDPCGMGNQPREEDSARLLLDTRNRHSSRKLWIWSFSGAAVVAMVVFIGRSGQTSMESSGVSELAAVSSKHESASKGEKKADVKVDDDLAWLAKEMRVSMEKHRSVGKAVEQEQAEQEEHLEAAENAMLARLEAKEKELEREQKRLRAARNKKDDSVPKEAEDMFVNIFSDMLGSGPDEQKNAKKEVQKARKEKELQAKKEEKKQREQERKERERLKEVQEKLKAAEAQWQKKQEKKEQEKKKEEKQKQTLAKAKKEFTHWQELEKKAPNISLYCFSLMMPFGYEPNLLLEQKKHSVGIFACHESAVFSNTTHLTTGEESPVPVFVVNESLAVAYGGRWMTALNTPVFNKLWMEVVRLQRYRFHDWTVKVDPDAVFFPTRLLELLHQKDPYNKIRPRPEPKHFKCEMCSLKGHETETCAAHVHWLQLHDHSCSQALEKVARPSPDDCGCVCDDFACDLPEEAVYLNNCKWGLHGPLEVFSRRAVATIAAGLPKCVPLLERPWGEDKFIDQCLIMLGINRDDEFNLLSETACGEQPAPCGSSDVTFHPFKSVQSYFTCHAYASKYGHGPNSMPELPNSTGEDKLDKRDAFIWQ